MNAIAQAPSSSTTKRVFRLSLVATAIALVSGCASVNNPNPADPWERYNRTMDTINYNVDRAVFRPVASAYDTLTPQPARTCISNMFNNVGDVWSAVNSFLQGRPHDFFNTLGRVLFNSTMGLGGCIDVHTKNGGERIRNDFGTTLGVWGMPSGPYVVLPFLGPSTVRDTTSLATAALDAKEFSSVAPITAIKNVPVRNSILGLYLVDMRANLLEADEMVNEVALDRYSFIRDAYLQRRNAMVESRRHGASENGAPLPDYEDYGDDYDDNATPSTEGLTN
ncbi:MAG TPA: VacJ family lipoprotein [Paenalcaligenes sp.]|nr:VacJ family lipoprotein [Paenalcaligenes sp.]